MKIEKCHEGKRVRAENIPVDLLILYVGERSFFVRYPDGSEGAWHKLAEDWILVEEKPKVNKEAPALVRAVKFRGRVMSKPSELLFVSEAEAREYHGNNFICWPAPLPDADGFYHVPEVK